MTNPTNPNPFAGFNAREAGDALWRAMDQFRTSVDKRVSTRMGRGDVRAAVLALLAEEPMHGYQIIREIEERTSGRWRPSAGSVYPTLQLLADEGLLTSSMSKDRKTYSLTDAGREEATAAQASAPWAESDAEPTSHVSRGPLSKAGFELAQAVGQMARTGSEAQIHEAAELLDETRRKIYSILAQA